MTSFPGALAKRIRGLWTWRPVEAFIGHNKADVVPAHLRGQVNERLKEQRLQNLPLPSAIAFLVLLVFVLRPGAWSNVSGLFYRINNVLSIVSLVLVNMVVRTNWKTLVRHTDVFLFCCLLHGVSYLSMSRC